MCGLTPAFVFIIAVISRCIWYYIFTEIFLWLLSPFGLHQTLCIYLVFRTEVLDLRMKSSRAKSVGTIISMAGALLVTLYKGLPILTTTSVPRKFLNDELPSLSLQMQSNWVIGGFLLLLQSFSLALLFVVQAWVIRDYPAELMASLLPCMFVTILSTAVALVAERSDLSAWELKSNTELVALGFNVRSQTLFRCLMLLLNRFIIYL